eukprot:14382-Heterococcus_DN1.PRE.6
MRHALQAEIQRGSAICEFDGTERTCSRLCRAVAGSIRRGNCKLKTKSEQLPLANTASLQSSAEQGTKGGAQRPYFSLLSGFLCCIH